MQAKFTRATEHRLGIRFEPETFEEQLLLETFTRVYEVGPGYEFKFSSWAQNGPGFMREGLTSCWGELVEVKSPINARREAQSAATSLEAVVRYCRDRIASLQAAAHQLDNAAIAMVGVLKTVLDHAGEGPPPSSTTGLPWHWSAAQAPARIHTGCGGEIDVMEDGYICTKCGKTGDADG